LYNPPLACGTMDDYQHLTTAAHDYGIAVNTYMTLLYLDWSAPFYLAAAANHTSHEGKCFKWNGSNADQSWGFPGFDWSTADAQQELTNVVQHWCNHGTDGFMYDAPTYAINGSAALRTKIMVEAANAVGGNKRIEGEGGFENCENTQANMREGFTQNLLEQDVDGAGIMMNIKAGSKTANDFESMLVTYRDYAAAHNGGSVSFAYDANEDAHAMMYACLGGSGVFVWYPYNDQPDNEWTQVYTSWSASRKTKLNAVMNAINGYAANEPGGGRIRCSTGNDGKYYAVKRTSMDGTRVGLNVFNFKNSTVTITVDLTGKGITVPQTPRNLITNAPAPSIASTGYSVTLPAYGYLLLGVNEGSTAAIPIAATGKVPKLSLYGNNLIVNSSNRVKPIVVDVYAANGSRIAHREQSTVYGDEAVFADLWKTPGLYYIKIRIDNETHTISGAGVAKQ
jgi:hypothetical protein